MTLCTAKSPKRQIKWPVLAHTPKYQVMGPEDAKIFPKPRSKLKKEQVSNFILSIG